MRVEKTDNCGRTPYFEKVKEFILNCLLNIENIMVIVITNVIFYIEF